MFKLSPRRGEGQCRYAFAVAAFLLSICASSPASEARPPAEAVAFGERLFFDKRLSADGTISCASCHVPSRAFSDGKRVAIGIAGQVGVRNTPSLTSAAVHDTFFWDGRRRTLESQVTEPLLNPREHGMSSIGQAVEIVRRNPEYSEFLNNGAIGADEIASALASYVRSLDGGVSRFDRYMAGDKKALSRDEREGLEIFRGAAQCSACHSVEGARPSFTDNKFHSAGLTQRVLGGRVAEVAMKSTRSSGAEIEALITTDESIAALGRFNVTRNPADIGKYRTPSLRDVAVTAPYMHDGSIATLEEVVDQELYYRGAQQGRTIVLTSYEKSSLAAFLRALTSLSLEEKQGSQ